MWRKSWGWTPVTLGTHQGGGMVWTVCASQLCSLERGASLSAAWWGKEPLRHVVGGNGDGDVIYIASGHIKLNVGVDCGTAGAEGGC